MEYYSQYKQDKFLHENIFKDHKNGIFVDAGAHDGVSLNNTLFFEKNYNWTGINIEPIKTVYDKLVVNRPNSININCAAGLSDGTAEFILNMGYTEMLSGLKNEYDNRHYNRTLSENHYNGGTTQVITVDVKTLDTILKENNIKHINYLSIDVEGAEYSVIKGIDFDNVFIDVIEFENNYPDTSGPILEYLSYKGYVIIPENTSIDIMMIHKNSKFYKK
jgi:FkbM family methyltransferase